jgi:hypothetical protein
MKRLLLALCIAALIPSLSHSQPFNPLPPAGSLRWGDWEFNWEIGSANSEGLVLKNVRYKGIAVIRKASMPVIRVKYRGRARRITSGCGPFRDRINAGNIERLPGATSDVVSRTFNDAILEIAVFSEIGGYDLYQLWYFHKSGRLEPRLYSRGWSCDEFQEQKDHKHHPYWRIDFDVEATGSNSDNQVWRVRTKSNGQVQTSQITEEDNDSRMPDDSDVAWTINRPGSEKHVLIRYSTNEPRDPEGTPWFALSNKDAAWRLYKSAEDIGWAFSATQHLGFISPRENINGKDIVFWLVGHLSHPWSQSDESNPVWHATGPTIDVAW